MAMIKVTAQQIWTPIAWLSCLVRPNPSAIPNKTWATAELGATGSGGIAVGAFSQLDTS